MDSKAYLGPGVAEVVSGMVQYEQIGIGGIVCITAEDALRKQQQTLRLQLLDICEVEGCHRPRAIFQILSDDFYFYNLHQVLFEGKTWKGGVFGTVMAGTLCLGGWSMHWLPVPRYAMVGVGGIGTGRDFNLECVDGLPEMAFIHNITELSVLPAQADFAPPANLAEYRSSVGQAIAKSNADREERSKSAWANLIEGLGKDLGETDDWTDWLKDLLASCCYNGAIAIGSFLLYAKEQGRLEEALRQLWCDRHELGHQPPKMKGDPDFASNREFYLSLYNEAGVELPSLAEQIEPPTGEALAEMREMLENPNLAEFNEVDAVAISEMPGGQIILADTMSGNRYLLCVTNPAHGYVSVMMLKRREGFPENGLIPPAQCQDLAVGDPLVTSDMNSTFLTRILVRKAE